MWRAAILLVLVIECVSAGKNEKPEYLKACSRTAADFKECCIKYGNDALPSLLKGDKQFKIPNLLPLRFPRVDVDAGPDLKISLTDIDLYGLESVKLTDMNVDFGQQKAYLDLHIDVASLVGHYEVDGKILILPLQGSGPINITIENSQFKYTASYKLETKKGKEYAILQPDDKLEFTIGKAEFKLDNLFNGNKQMGDNVNNFLNENQQDVLKELSGAISGTITAVARRVGGGVIENIPFNELFLP